MGNKSSSIAFQFSEKQGLRLPYGQLTASRRLTEQLTVGNQLSGKATVNSTVGLRLAVSGTDG